MTKLTESQAFTKLDYSQRVPYDEDSIDVYFDVEVESDFRGVSVMLREGAQAFYNGHNVTDLVNWEKVDKAINWKRVEEEARDRDDEFGGEA